MSDSHLCGLTVVKDFVLIGQHTCPKHAMKEIDQLYDVFTGIHKKWKTDVGYTLSELCLMDSPLTDFMGNSTLLHPSRMW